MQNAWNNFVKTGQIWALLIGIAIGYFFRSMTSFYWSKRLKDASTFQPSTNKPSLATNFKTNKTQLL
jgi:ABC-type enterochelin transport system permease subunit